jgi:phage head maturation protease
MSTTETDIQEQNPETAERPFLVREFVATDMEIKGRTVDVRLVPFGEVARVADPPKWVPYDEEWLPGVFDHQLNAANRIHAKYGHSDSVVDVVGHGLSLRSVAGDGYHVSTTIHDTIQGETALELLRGGALPAVSLEARPVRSHRTSAGVVQRMRANLSGFAFCRIGAFVGAQVLALREEHVIDDEVVLDPEFVINPLDPEIVERCRRLGIALPQRYEAHPDEPDTPAEAGTSEDGTRPETTS